MSHSRIMMGMELRIPADVGRLGCGGRWATPCEMYFVGLLEIVTSFAASQFGHSGAINRKIVLRCSN